MEGASAQDPVLRLAAAMSALYEAAGHPPYSELKRQGLAQVPEVKLPSSTLNDWLRGKSSPADARVFRWLVDYLEAKARRRGSDQVVLAQATWDRMRERALEHRRPRRGGRPAHERHADYEERDLDPSQHRPERAAGWPLAAVTNPFDYDLEIHQSVQPEMPRPGLPPLPIYVTRDHDRELERVVMSAARGHSEIAILVGGSSTGKTRACWEALELLRAQAQPWHLWHPIDPSRPDAALRELPQITSHTVVWLNEAQFYLDAPEGAGEQVAAGLRELLRDPAKSPVLVLATLWPDYWSQLSTRPKQGADDAHAQARQLLTDNCINVPASFTAAQLPLLAATQDPRLALAAGTEAGRVTQFLAGAPELIARYRNAQPSAAALINVAIDARRLGVFVAVPRAFLESAATGYLDDPDWDALPDDWLDRALDYATVSCKGARGLLSRVRPRTAASGTSGPVYRLADYVEQHGRHARRRHIPPASFWQAAQQFIDPSKLPLLATLAERRGLLREAAAIRVRATGLGDASEAARLVANRDSLHPDSVDSRPAQWAVAHAALTDPGDVAWLVTTLRRAGLDEQVHALFARDPAAHAALDEPGGVARLLHAMCESDEERQIAALTARDPARAAVLDDPGDVVSLLLALWRADATEQISVLAWRAIDHVPVSQLHLVTQLLSALRTVGAKEQAAELARRILRLVRPPVHELRLVAQLLSALRAEGADEEATALLDLASAAHVDLRAPAEAAQVLLALRDAGAEEWAAELARRAVIEAPVRGERAVNRLLAALRQAGAPEQASELARYVVEHVPFNDPRAVTDLLSDLRGAGAEELIAALLARDPASCLPLDSLHHVAWLLSALWQAGANEQAVVLARRAINHVPLENGWAVNSLLSALEEAGTEVPTAALARRAADIPHTNPWAVAKFVLALHKAGAEEQATELARRTVNHVPLDKPDDVYSLLSALRKAGLMKEAATLLARDPASRVQFNRPDKVAKLLSAFMEVGAEEQAAILARRAIDCIDLDKPDDVYSLLSNLRESGLRRQAAELALDALDHTPADESSRFFARILPALRQGGAEEEAAALIVRDLASRVRLDDQAGVAELLFTFVEVGAEEQAAILARRAIDYTSLDVPSSVRSTLSALREAGLIQQAAELARRAIGRTPLNGIGTGEALVHTLQQAGASDEAAELVEELAAEGHFSAFLGLIKSPDRYKFGLNPDGSAASPWGWDDLG